MNGYRQKETTIVVTDHGVDNQEKLLLPHAGRRSQGAGDARQRAVGHTPVCRETDNAADSVPCDRIPIVSIGELVWDIFPDGRRLLGGAPVNVAWNLTRLGDRTLLVTRIGDDSLGREAQERIAALGLPAAGVQLDGELPTGRVEIRLAAGGEPRFEVASPAAWDALAAQPALELLGKNPFVLIFGTLAQRAAPSRAAIRQMAARAAVSFYDVNLRPPFTSRELVQESLGLAKVVKMNGGELATLAAWHGLTGSMEEMGRSLCAICDFEALAVTLGADGAWLFTRDGQSLRQPALTVQAVDPVGAGDAFLAGLVHGCLAGTSWPETLALAVRLGAEAAARAGAIGD